MGKNRRWALIFVMSFLTIIDIRASNINDFTFRFITGNIFDLPERIIPDLERTTNKIVIGSFKEDILVKFIGDKQVFSLGTRGVRGIYEGTPFQIKQEKIGLSVKISTADFYFDNRKDLVDFNFWTKTRTTIFDIRLWGKDGHFPFFHVWYFSSPFRPEIQIRHFPFSENPAMNSYFYNLIPSAIGDRLEGEDGKMDADGFKVELPLEWDKNNQLRLGLGYQNFRLFSIQQYWNLTDSPLSGERHLKLELGIKDLILAVNYIHLHGPLRVITSTGFLWQQFRLTLIPYNVNGELKELESSYFSRFPLELVGGFANLMIKVRGFSFQVAAGIRALDSRARFQTPVLVYDYPLIAVHRAQLDITGRIVSRGIGLGYTGQIRSCNLDGRIAFSEQIVESPVDGTAKMEFGLVTQPIQENFKYRIRFFHLRFRSRIRISQHVLFLINLNQYLPIIQRLDHNPVKLKEGKSKKVKKDYRGGLTVNLGIMLPFD